MYITKIIMAMIILEGEPQVIHFHGNEFECMADGSVMEFTTREDGVYEGHTIEGTDGCMDLGYFKSLDS